MWTSQEFEGIMENVTVIRRYKDGVHSMTQLLAHEGYAMHQIGDEGYIDEEGNYVPPTYSYQVTFHARYEDTMLPIYEAVLIEEGMEVVGQPTTPPEVEVM